MIYCLLHLYFVYAVYTPLIIETPKYEKTPLQKEQSFQSGASKNQIICQPDYLYSSQLLIAISSIVIVQNA